MTTAPEPTDWQSMASAPRDGTRILVALRASEQGPAEVDVVKWVKSDRFGEEIWLATDSERDAPVTYPDADLEGWMPLPTALPKLRSARTGEPREADEQDGSAI